MTSLFDKNTKRNTGTISEEACDDLRVSNVKFKRILSGYKNHKTVVLEYCRLKKRMEKACNTLIKFNNGKI